MLKLFKKYLSIEKIERDILNRTFFWLIYSFVLVRMIPLKWFNSILGEYRKKGNEVLTKEQIGIITILTKNIRRLKKHLPWKVKCFEESIAAKKVLEKYKIKSTIYLGVAKKGEKNLVAHAWLKSGEFFVTGEKGHKKHVVVGNYS